MYVVTGATGNTGRVVAERLLAGGQHVRVIGRNADRLRPFAADGAKPFVADVADAAALVQAFLGAQAVYVMVPPNIASPSVHAYQNRVIDAIAKALQQAGVNYAVALSSIGADKPGKTGPVVGLHQLEQKLNKIPGLNVLYLRAGYFMENTLAQAGIIRTTGKSAGSLQADLKIPMIATQDVGLAAAEALLKLDFKRQQTRELLGERDLTMAETMTIVGKTIGKPDLQYVQLPGSQIQPILKQLGMSENFAELLLEMTAALNSGYMRALEKRSAQNTTSTSYETFAAQAFAPLYKAKSHAA
jgi:uncharacterized protein YbjT (DUF2867 family)